jgi:hypothetical protein
VKPICTGRTPAVFVTSQSAVGSDYLHNPDPRLFTNHEVLDLTKYDLPLFDDQQGADYLSKVHCVNNPEEKCFQEFRSLDGSFNNLDHPEFGKAGIVFPRQHVNAFADGKGTDGSFAVRGTNNPNTRQVSNQISYQGCVSIPSQNHLSGMHYALGQYIDHDVGLTKTDSSFGDCSISVPQGDPQYAAGSKVGSIKSANGQSHSYSLILLNA